MIPSLSFSLTLTQTHANTHPHRGKVMSLPYNGDSAWPSQTHTNTLRGKEQAQCGIWLSQQCHIGNVNTFISPARGLFEHMHMLTKPYAQTHWINRKWFVYLCAIRLDWVDLRWKRNGNIEVTDWMPVRNQQHFMFYCSKRALIVFCVCVRIC